MTDLILIVSTVLGLVTAPGAPPRAPASDPPPTPAPREETWQEVTPTGVVLHCARSPVYGYRGEVIGEVKRCF